MHLKKITLFSEKYPTKEHYPFNIPVLNETRDIVFDRQVTFFVGENGTGKSTLLEAIARRSRFHIWRGEERTRFRINPYEQELYRCIRIEWDETIVPGCFFASNIFGHFAEVLDDWAASDPGILEYFGGTSLMEQSHGQSLMSFFASRFKRRGLYLLDEPETALSPKKQLDLLRLLQDTGRLGYAQFIIATHSPILLACPDAAIYSFDHVPLAKVEYEQTGHYNIFRDFLNGRDKYLNT